MTPATIGVISDTHGLLRPEAVAALQDCGLILHAGDIGKPDVLAALQEIAPVRAIRGNNDTDEWAAELPEREIITIDNVQIYMLHDVKELDIDPNRAGHNIVISGHSHKPSIEKRAGVIFLNPGAAGPHRFLLPVSVARIDIDNGQPRAQIIELRVAPARSKRTRQS